MLSVSALLLCPGKSEVHFEESTPLRAKKKLFLYSVLFLFSLLSVFRLVDYRVTLVLVLLALLFFARPLFARVDYSLLLTFVCFFIFAGNMGSIPLIRNFLTDMLQKSTLLSSVLASQVISNVPAAVLLSGFTDNWRELLLGVNIGGLGTPIASLASLISLKYYLRSENARAGHYLLLFTGANLLLLLIFVPAALFFC